MSISALRDLFKKRPKGFQLVVQDQRQMWIVESVDFKEAVYRPLEGLTIGKQAYNQPEPNVTNYWFWKDVKGTFLLNPSEEPETGV